MKIIWHWDVFFTESWWYKITLKLTKCHKHDSSLYTLLHAFTKYRNIVLILVYYIFHKDKSSSGHRLVYTPCQPSDQDAIEMTWLEIQPDQLAPSPITMVTKHARLSCLTSFAYVITKHLGIIMVYKYRIFV